MLVLWLYRETTMTLGNLWAQWGGGYGHGYLVLGISLYLVYLQRSQLKEIIPCPSVAALFAVATCSLLWLAATLVDVQVVQYSIMLPLIISVIWAVAGGRVVRQLLFPVLFIGFAIPIWSPLLPVLQAITADLAFWMTRASGIPAMRQEYLVILPEGRLKIAEACSGLHYLLAALTLGVFYAYLNYQRLWHRALVVIIAAAAAILVNILRVYIVIYLAYISDMQHPFVKDHLGLGWYLFAGLVFILLLVDMKLNRPAVGLDVGGGPANKEVAPGACVRGMFQRQLLLIGSAGLIALGPAMAWWIERPVDFDQEIVLAFPEAGGAWGSPFITQDSWMPVYRGAIAEKRAYHNGASELYLYSGYYAEQSQGSELINDLNRIGAGKGWGSQSLPVKVLTGDNMAVLEQVIESSTGRRRLVWFWYEVAGQPTVNAYEAKLLQVKGLITGRPQAAVFAMATDLDGDVATARELLSGFISLVGQPLVRASYTKFQAD